MGFVTLSNEVHDGTVVSAKVQVFDLLKTGRNIEYPFVDVMADAGGVKIRKGAAASSTSNLECAWVCLGSA
jgi:hypothetical protein